MKTHHLVIDFGRHQGTLYTRVPVSYLKWMVNTDHTHKGIAQAELERRGTVTPDADISGHAIDRASLFCFDIYRRTRHKGEGLNAWLIRMMREAMDAGLIDDTGKHLHNDMKFAIDDDGIWPMLVTVMRKTQNERGGNNGRK